MKRYEKFDYLNSSFIYKNWREKEQGDIFFANAHIEEVKVFMFFCFIIFFYNFSVFFLLPFWTLRFFIPHLITVQPKNCSL